MFTKIFQNRLPKLVSIALLFSVSSYSFKQRSSFHQSVFPQLFLKPFAAFFSPVYCFTTIRVNKPELIKLINEAKQQIIVLVYNKESQDQLKDTLIKYSKTIKQNGINKIALADQTDIRHLETFTRILRQDIEDDDKIPKTRQPIDLHSQIKIFYITPQYSKPFLLEFPSLPQSLAQIRNILHLNPFPSQLQQSISTFNRTTIIKNCYNDVCVQEYKEKIRQLIQLELFRDKADQWKFFVTTGKNQAQKVANVVQMGNDKQEIYVWRNDLIGKGRFLYSQWVKEEGNKYGNQNRFMMMIRPRVHIISKKSLSTDLFWYMSTIRNNEAATFSINNTMSNFPISLTSSSSPSSPSILTYIKGHISQTLLLRALKQKYPSLQILILESTLPSQLFRHLYSPERYCVFRLAPEVPYPKVLIQPKRVKMDLELWDAIRDVNDINNGQKAGEWKYRLEGDTQDYQQKWAYIISKVDKFLQSPSTTPIKLLTQKQHQINGQQLQSLLSQSQSKSKSESPSFIFRMCSSTSCLYSVYQQYGIDLKMPVYRIDGQVQNIGIDYGDYVVQDGKISRLG